MIYRKLLLFFLIAAGFSTRVNSQTFNCYIANDTITSPYTYKFDVYIVATTTDFYFRTLQLGLQFHPAFFPAGATITPSIVSGSTELNSYVTTTPMWLSSLFCLSVPSNTGISCIGSP